ncbi:transporter substrate-binding domain-containing protein [Paracoccus sp. MBLB3053]|uniref:Transporter substrate-binding domain-containing protein n=1 Tax=Paracoccus aurantius TaxID=3073814 RepID=A0ABU2HX66_9RHOB|nr:transporter substrate-binding domain-containing protein [Paracoccus sp. MBLB3053]MDS9469645.1 transporter substrate-binding domain-containing protein [Paracoccus sp. MBLB3053]
MKREDSVHIGVMFSQTGWTAVTERSMLAATTFAIDEINQTGGINGRELVPVYRDPAGVPAAYQAMAADLLSDGKIKVILGCYTSSQRKAVLNVLERAAGLLCYPAQYEGFEYSENIIYFGAVPNQNSVFLAQYLLKHHAPRIYIVGSDYVWPRESGRIMGDLIRSGGGEVLGERYLSDTASPAEFDSLIKDILRCAPEIIFNNFVGQSNLDFYRAYKGHGLDASRAMVCSLTTSEADIQEIGTAATEGHITAATYFASQTNPANIAMLARYEAAMGEPPAANMCWDAAYTQTHMVAQAMRTGSTDNMDSIRAGILDASFDALQGRISIDPSNLHCHVWPKIGIARSDGQFDIVDQTDAAIRPDPYRTTYSLASEDQDAAIATPEWT